jgi:DNA-binding transcriptional MerR regulator
MTSPPASDRPGSEASSISASVRLSDSASDQGSPARATERLVQRFGGIRPMANKLEVPVTTVQGWKKRGAIPATRLADLRLAAQRHGIGLDEAELDLVCRSDERHAEAARPAAPVREAPPAAGPVPVDTPLPVEPVVHRAEALPPFEVAAEPAPEAEEVPGAMPERLSAARERMASVQAAMATAGQRFVVSGATRLSLAAAAVALLGAGIAVWSPPGASPAVPSSSAASTVSERRIGDLESKVARVALEQGAQTAAIEKQISALDSRLIQAASKQSATELAERIAVLERDLPALQQRMATQGIGAPALGVLLSATQLRGVLATSGPFVNELAALRLTGFNDPPLRQALEAIGGRAASGIATEAWLIGRFSAVQANILRAASLGNPLARIGDVFLDTLSDWVPPLYRMTGVSEGAAPRAVADRAQAAMAAGDFPRAVDILGELSGLPAEVAAPWLAEARARVVADRSRTLLAKHMLSIATPK